MILTTETCSAGILQGIVVGLCANRRNNNNNSIDPKDMHRA